VRSVQWAFVGTTAASWITRSRNRALIWGLQRLQRLMQAAWFERWVKAALIGPMVRLGLLWFVWAIFFGKVPESTPEIALLSKQVREQFNARLAHSEGTERDRVVAQTMTWGTAGIEVLILTAIITAHPPSLALEVATAALAVSVPFLVVLGFLYTLQSDPRTTPPTVKAAFFQAILLYAAHLLFYFVLAALLWSYDPRIAAVFVIACYMAWRYLQRHFAPKPTESDGAGDRPDEPGSD